MTHRVAITTTADRAERLGALARGHGIHPVPLPCIQMAVAPHDELALARSEAEGSEWLLITSARAVTSLWPEGDMPSVPVAAVGASTAEAVAAAGGRVELVGDGGAGEVVSWLIDERHPRSVFFPHAAGADPASVETLAEAGVHVTAQVVYQIRPVAPGPDPVDAAAFGSPSAVEGWVSARGLAGIVLAAIGETTAAALARHGAAVDVVAPCPRFDLLISALAEHLRERSHV